MRAPDHGPVGGVYVEAIERSSFSGPCKFSYVSLPRARALAQFERGEKVDVLPLIVRSPERDVWGEFVPILSFSPALIVVGTKTSAPISALDRGELQVLVVGNFDYGNDYQSLLQRLTQMQRVDRVIDITTAVRMIRGGRAQATIMGPTLFYDAWRSLGEKSMPDIYPMSHLPRSEVGIYLSYKTLSSEDRMLLKRQLEQEIATGSVWRGYHAAYPPQVLASFVPYSSRQQSVSHRPSQ